MRVDLDLLPILSTLLAERSVSRTAAKMNLTQPAISYALAKLRDQLAAPLLVKSGNKMKPTQRARSLARSAPAGRLGHAGGRGRRLGRIQSRTRAG